MSASKSLILTFSLSFMALVILLPTPQLTRNEMRILPSSHQKSDTELVIKNSLINDKEIQSFFSHHQKEVKAAPLPPKKSVIKSQESPVSQEEIIGNITPIQQVDRFQKIGQSYKNNQLSFFIKDAENGIISEFLLNTPYIGFILVKKDNAYFLESLESGVLYPL